VERRQQARGRRLEQAGSRCLACSTRSQVGRRDVCVNRPTRRCALLSRALVCSTCLLAVWCRRLLRVATHQWRHHPSAVGGHGHCHLTFDDMHTCIVEACALSPVWPLPRQRPVTLVCLCAGAGRGACVRAVPCACARAGPCARSCPPDARASTAVAVRCQPCRQTRRGDVCGVARRRRLELAALLYGRPPRGGPAPGLPHRACLA